MCLPESESPPDTTPAGTPPAQAKKPGVMPAGVSRLRLSEELK